MASSTEHRSLCNVCNYKYAIYTCPRCTTRTCSLPCSSSHKSSTGCSGERNKAAYVPMNRYGWGTMMDDYTFLEGVGRKVEGWGREIARGRFGNGRPAVRGRGRGGGSGGAGSTTKRDVLKVQLDMRDIEMELLPVGMERRKMNESSWDFKNKTALLTVQFKFNPPRNPFAPSSQQPDPPFVLVTHRNNINQTLLSLIQGHVKDRAKSKNSCPGWVKSLVLPNPSETDSFVPPQCVMPAQINSVTINPGSRPYYSFNPLESFVSLLRKTHFVEFPTIEIWEEFEGTVLSTEGTIVRQKEERPLKRRKLTSKASKAAMNGLLGAYGSEEEDETDSQNVLSILGDYVGSDEEFVDDERKGEDYADADGVTDEEVDIDLDPAALLELVRQIEDGKQLRGGVNNDNVDWGDSDDGGDVE
ncbi:uncharacterized protein LACBIDRAFT_305745 [Laccaria bicolor S238N-H82]|uniref:Predicted protein n=1 Tax=Laccaria bicolor (strain S238N-H82 / ATCC MYA-4686) TaxID=486041 RepID=B0CRU7_LACBS|nr:uncharacterized protein LACBIDRAFT_305745 [Laccaria bicolor S238N-H82]EDR14183.1 predicted protein [Laccaria bicolor S238N-H82]|eukprot:XP_001874742.1 predicted protein [Laccaria bicolor S238N-H82]